MGDGVEPRAVDRPHLGEPLAEARHLRDEDDLRHPRHCRLELAEESGEELPAQVLRPPEEALLRRRRDLGPPAHLGLLRLDQRRRQRGRRAEDHRGPEVRERLERPLPRALGRAGHEEDRLARRLGQPLLQQLRRLQEVDPHVPHATSHRTPSARGLWHSSASPCRCSTYDKRGWPPLS